MSVLRLAATAATLLSAIACANPTPIRRQQPDSTEDTAAAASTICGEIIQYVDQGESTFFAVDAYECLKSVPFNSAVASRFIDYYNETLQLQSTLAYLKNPPEGYQQPALDVAAEMQRLKESADGGYYRNQYEFETDVMDVVRGFHDGHTQLTSGILAAFTFGAPVYITSASADGKQEPELYITDDILYRMEGFEISPITHINGEDATTYLTRFAATHSVGLLEPHADFNHLMGLPAQFLRGLENAWSGTTTFYPGDELNFQFANGSTLNASWEAYYNELPGNTGPLTTGGDFYNYYVLGFLPASCNTPNGTNCPLNPPPPGYEVAEASDDTKRKRQDDDSEDSEDSTDDSTDSLSSWSDLTFGAYPEPDVIQKGLGYGGYVTGYILGDVGVLSIPSFSADGFDVDTFSEAIRDFTANATEANVTKVIIDLQYNEGGTPILAFDVFHAFFPGIEPFAGSQRRSQSLANSLGGAFTEYWSGLSYEEDYYNKTLYAGNEWVVTTRLNVETNTTFTSWPEYYGPRPLANDTFSKIERYNLSDQEFSVSAFDGYMLDPTDRSGSTPWSPSSIVLLTDGLCSSTCVLFTEMMTHQAGVRTLALGGAPSPGPMQFASGSRGASAYSASLLDNDITLLSSISSTARTTLPQIRDESIFTVFAGVNLRDQVRDDDTTPLQFKYLPADCRLYYTLSTAFNLTQLWLDVASAAFTDPSLCIANSTIYSTSPLHPSPQHFTPPPPPVAAAPQGGLRAFAWAEGVHFENDAQAGLSAENGANEAYPPRSPQDWFECASSEAGSDCNNKRGSCVARTVTCPSGPFKGKNTVYVCSPKCAYKNNNKGSCGGNVDCKSSGFATVGTGNGAARRLRRDDEYDVSPLEKRQRFLPSSPKPAAKPPTTPNTPPGSPATPPGLNPNKKRVDVTEKKGYCPASVAIVKSLYPDEFSACTVATPA